MLELKKPKTPQNEFWVSLPWLIRTRWCLTMPIIPCLAGLRRASGFIELGKGCQQIKFYRIIQQMRSDNRHWVGWTQWDRRTRKSLHWREVMRIKENNTRLLWKVQEGIHLCRFIGKFKQPTVKRVVSKNQVKSISLLHITNISISRIAISLWLQHSNRRSGKNKIIPLLWKRRHLSQNLLNDRKPRYSKPNRILNSKLSLHQSQRLNKRSLNFKWDNNHPFKWSKMFIISSNNLQIVCLHKIK